MPYIGAGTQRFNTADGLTVSGTSEFDATATITTADNDAQLVLKSTDADASAGPLIKMHRDSSSPADGDALGRFNFIGENDADEEVTYARIHAKANDVTDGEEDGELLLMTTVAGTNRSRMHATPSEVVFNEDSIDTDFRVEGDSNANLLFVDAGNDKVAIGTGTAVGTLTTECTAGDSNFALTAYHPTSTSSRTIAKFQSNVGSTQADVVTIGCDGGITTTGALDVTTSTHANASVFKSTGNTQLFLQDTDASSDDQFWGLQVSGGDFNILTCDDDRSGGFVTPLTIAQAGDLLLGTASLLSDGKLSIAANLGSRTCSTMKNTVSQGSGHTYIRFTNSSNALAGSIQHTGTTTTNYGTSSDYRLKQGVQDMTGAIDRVKALAPKRFAWVADDDDRTVDGFLAHEAQTVVPEAVTGTHNELETWTQQQIDDGDAPDGTSAGDNKLDGDGNTIPVMQQIDHSKLVPLLTGALQEAIAKIETLETEMTALKARVTALEDA